MLISGVEIAISGRVFRTAKVRAEYYDVVSDGEAFIGKLRDAQVAADLFTFVQEIHQPAPRYAYHWEADSISVLPITTYEAWWKSQISDKTRNMVRKAGKKGVEIRLSEFTDDFVKGIMGIYNESPVRQGKRFWHYGKDFQSVKRENATYLDRGILIGAYLGDELIGFTKLVFGDRTANLMQILSKMAHRDKAPTNALIAKAIEVCAQRGVPRLHYGMWSRRGLGVFKANHGFQRVDVPRYFVPLDLRGQFMLRFNLHRGWKQRLPETWVDTLASARANWYQIRHRQGVTADR